MINHKHKPQPDTDHGQPEGKPSPITQAVEPRLCEECGIEIPVKRLRAKPETRLCVKCKEELEDERLFSQRLSS